MKLKILVSTLFLLCFATPLLAQYTVTINATVSDKLTRQPIPYVNISFTQNKTINTITDTQGRFTLQYDEALVSKNDTLIFSALAYRKEKVSVQRFYKLLKNTTKIYLYPKTYQTDKIITKIQTQKGNIYGRVYTDSIPLQGARVQVKNTFTETQTDNQGRYRIAAQKGTILKVTFLGMKPKEVLIAKNQQDINLKPDSELLKTVVLKGKTKEDNKVDIGIGTAKKNFDAIGYDVKTLKAKDIAPQYNKVSDLLNGRFAGVSIAGTNLNGMPEVWMRSGHMSMNYATPAIYDIDGVVYDYNYPYVAPQQIASLVILKSLAATNKYGSRGNGGVIVIRTKTFVGAKAAPPKKIALIKGNDYTESLPLYKTTAPNNLQALNKATSYKEALKIYQQQTNGVTQKSIPFYLNSSDYFRKWNTAFADKILSDITQAAYNNATALKTLAFKYETLKQYNNAKQIYQHIAVLRPKYAQSYRDLALIYQKTENYKEAMTLYKKILANTIDSIDFSGISDNLSSELQHLLKTHRSKVAFKGLPSQYLNNDFKYDVRIVFEWNNPYAEFKVQFVNPDKKYFTWNHSKFADKDQLYKEITNGYQSAEYIIDQAKAKGTWLVNLQSLNNTKTLNPTYLKYTVYRHYGLPNQTQTTKLINLLNQLTEKVTLDEIAY